MYSGYHQFTPPGICPFQHVDTSEIDSIFGMAMTSYVGRVA